MSLLTDSLQRLANEIFAFIPQPQPTAEAMKKVKIVAHRGDRSQEGVKENTMDAFLACQNKGIWAIEFDIRWTKDNEPVVHHDANTKRVFGENCEISNLSLSELKTKIPPVPTLKEVVEKMAPNLHMMIELKTKLSEVQAKKLKALLAHLKPIEDFHIMSLKPKRFEALNEYPQKTFVTIAETNIKSMFKQTIENNYGALTGQYVLLTNKIKQTCHQNQIKTGTGFIDNKNLAYREINRNINWLFTNQAIKIANLCNHSKK